MTIINSINYFILVFFLFSATIYTILLVSAVTLIFQFFKRSNYTNAYALLQSKDLPPVTIITPMFNEAHRIKENVLSSLKSDYPNLYVLLVNDGSTDETVPYLIEEFNMVAEPLIFEEKIKTAKVHAIYVSKRYPNLMLLDKEHSSVGDTLNAGINACFTPYFATIDADSTLDKKAISELMFELLGDPNAIGIGGAVYIRNACDYKEGEMLESKMPYRLVPALQSNEYLRSHLFNRTGWNNLGSCMSYSGTASLFSTATVRAVNGFDINNFAQDTEMVMRLEHYMHNAKRPFETQILFNPSVSVWTDVPNTLKQFTVQRDKWQRGLLRSVWHYRSMFFNPRYKLQGLFAFPVYVILEIIAPIVEVLAYIMIPVAYFLGILNLTSLLLFVLLAWGFIAFLSMATMLINLTTFNQYKRPMDILWMFLLAFIEMFGFHQYLTLVKVYGTFHYLINRIRGLPV